MHTTTERARTEARGHGVPEENRIGTIIVEEAIRLHRDLGPGLLESVYEVALTHRLVERGLSVHRQVPVQITLDGVCFDEGFRADLVVSDCVVVELKSLEATHPVHRKQLLTYVRLSGHKVGYLLNFGAELMRDGITRVIHGEL